jgi:hypothetical protein
VETPAAVSILSFCSLVPRDTRNEIRSEVAQFSPGLLSNTRLSLKSYHTNKRAPEPGERDLPV